jgi:hypothetical protein
VLLPLLKVKKGQSGLLGPDMHVLVFFRSTPHYVLLFSISSRNLVTVMRFHKFVAVNSKLLISASMAILKSLAVRIAFQNSKWFGEQCVGTLPKESTCHAASHCFHHKVSEVCCSKFQIANICTDDDTEVFGHARSFPE